jgi:transcriptional regulator of acetoin/glycerol metabolism
MNIEREKVRCLSCELMQWSGRTNCRRCGRPLPERVVQIVERVVEKVVFRSECRCLETLERATRVLQSCAEKNASASADEAVEAVAFPTIADMERSMILAAYERSEHKPLVAARLLGIGKTTVYRKLKEMGQIAA